MPSEIVMTDYDRYAEISANILTVQYLETLADLPGAVFLQFERWGYRQKVHKKCQDLRNPIYLRRIIAGKV